MKELIEKIKELSPDHRNYLITSLITDNTISFKEISESYVNSLENKNKEKNQLILSMAVPLSHYWDTAKEKKKQDIFMKCRGAYSLLKSRIFHTAQIEKTYEEWLEKHPYEEEDGHPVFKH